MKHAYITTAICALSVCVAQAASEEDICERLAEGLEEKVEILAAVKDAASAAAAVQPLQKVLTDLDALHGQVDESALWLYIENHPKVKQELIEALQLLSVQFLRLQKNSFYGNEALEQLLTPQITPGADAV